MTANELLIALENKRVVCTDTDLFVFKVRDRWMTAHNSGNLWVDLFYTDRFTNELKTNISLSKFKLL